VSEVVTQGSKYTDEDRQRVALEFLITGNMKRVAENTGIPRTTILGWKKTEWWDELVVNLRHEKGEELDANLTKLIDASFEQAQDRVENGDYRLNKKDELIRVPMSGRDLVIAGATVYDKQRLHRNQATQINAQAGDEFTKSFIEEFTQIARTYKEKQTRVVSTQGSDDAA